MPTDKVSTLKQAPLFASLEYEALATLAREAGEKRLARNEILFFAGDNPSGLFVIAAGSVRAFRTGIDGREQIIHVEKAVTTIAELPLFDEGNYPSTVAAEEDSTLLFIPKDAMMRASLRYPQIALSAARLFAKRLRNCAELVESLSLREVGQRIAQLLLEEAGKQNANGSETVSFVLPLTQNQIAARIGTVREVVSRVMTRLQQRGFVTIKGKRVTLTDVAALEAYAGRDSETF